MKKIWLVILGLLLLTASAAQAQFDYTNINGSITITLYTGSSLAVTVPSTIVGLPVTSIGESAFSDAVYGELVTSVTIPDGVTSIGDYAFEDCVSLTTVTIGSGLTNIGQFAFSDCPSLTSVFFHGNAPTEGREVFILDSQATGYYSPGTSGWVSGSGYEDLDNTVMLNPPNPNGSLQLTINPAGAVSAGAQWQVDNGVLQPSGATVLGLSVGNHTVSFTAISGLTTPLNQIVSVSANSIATGGGFYTAAVGTQFTCTTNNGAITITGYNGPGGTVTIPITLNGLPVSSIGDAAFYENTNVTAVAIGTNVTSIGDSAFLYCSLSSVTIPNSVTTIGGSAFYSCRGLTNVAIPSSVNSIGIEAFGQCTSLTAILVDAQNSFYSSLDGVLFDKSQTTLVEFPAGVRGSYTISNGVTRIAESAFYSGSLTSVTIPSSVINIGDLAFVGGPLTAITVNAQNSIYSSVNGVLFDKSRNTLVEYPGGGRGSYTIPNNVTSIGADAFYAQYGLISVTIPNSITNIGSRAFWNSGLTSITLPGSITSIGQEAFGSIFSLTGAYFQGNAPIGDSTVFTGDNNTKAYYLPGTTGWGATFGGIPTALWFLPNPLVLNKGANFGVKTNRFGFTISWATNSSVVVEACTNLMHPAWLPVATNTLTGGSSYFSDAKWTNYPRRFYRLSSP